MYHHRYTFFHVLSPNNPRKFAISKNILRFLHSLFLTDILTFRKTDVTHRITLWDGLATETTRSIAGSLEPNHDLMILSNPMEHEFITMNSLFHEIKPFL